MFKVLILALVSLTFSATSFAGGTTLNCGRAERENSVTQDFRLHINLAAKSTIDFGKFGTHTLIRDLEAENGNGYVYNDQQYPTSSYTIPNELVLGSAREGVVKILNKQDNLSYGVFCIRD